MNKKHIKLLGDVITIINPVSMLVLSYILNGIRGLVIFTIIYAISALISQILKGIFDAPRPRDSYGLHVIYIKKYSHNDGESFLSQHMMSASAPATYALFFSSIWIFVLYTIIACICGWTRVYVKAHWLLDVISAYILCFNVSVLVAYIYKLCII